MAAQLSGGATIHPPPMSAADASRVSAMRRNGNNAPREALLNYIVGRDARRKGSVVRERTQARTQRDLQREQARPRNSGSDVAASRQRGGSDQERRRQRLEDMEI